MNRKIDSYDIYCIIGIIITIVVWLVMKSITVQKCYEIFYAYLIVIGILLILISFRMRKSR